MHVIEATGISEAAEAFESGPKKHAVAREKEGLGTGTARQVRRCLRRRQEKGAGICGVLSRKAQQHSPVQRRLPVAGYSPEQAERGSNLVRIIFRWGRDFGDIRCGLTV